MARLVQELYVHCADTPNGSTKFTIRDLDRWHCMRGFMRKPEHLDWQPTLPYIAYHGIIDCAGIFWPARHLEEIGQHAAGHNWNSIGYCLMGTDSFTPAQWVMLASKVEEARVLYPGIVVRGHREVSDKACPGFSVTSWLASGMAPLAGHIL